MRCTNSAVRVKGEMSAMEGVSSEGACSVGDPIFVPLENALGKRPAKYVSARHVSIFAVL